MLLTFLAFLMQVTLVYSAASCGSSGIPFRFEVMPDGRPVLGCASPICFGTEAGGQTVMYDSQLDAGPDGVDGFFREGDLDKLRSRYSDAPSQLADCQPGFTSKSCNGQNKWVGGINVDSDKRLDLQCCSYEGMKFSTEVGRPIVRPGEVYSGGEVIRDGRQTGFDLICNIKQISESYGKSAYQLTVCRMGCIPDPVEDVNEVNINEQNDINKILDKVAEPSSESQPLAVLPQNNEAPIPNENQNLHPASADPTSSYSLSPPSIATQEQSATVEHIQGTETDQVVQIGESVVPVQSGGGYYYPVAGGTPACFPTETIVKTRNGDITMKELEVGDYVLTKFGNTTTYTEVLTFMHLMPQQKASFVQIKTENGNILEMTPLHFIYKTSCASGESQDQLIYAQDLNVDDCLYSLNKNNGTLGNQKTRIVQLTTVERTGIYAPLTSTGDLYTNNILTSCYNVIKSSTLSHSFFSWFYTIQTTFKSLLNNKTESETIVELPSTVRFLFQVISDILPK